MLRALAWKEYREQRQVALLGLFAAAMLPVLYFAIGWAINGPGFRFDSSDILVMTFFVAAVIVWPVFAAVAGAATNPREARVGSLGFLLSRPVSRGRVWGVKVGLGLATLVTVIAGSVLVFWALLRLAYGPSIPLLRGSVEMADIAGLSGHLILAFACSVFYATLMANSLVAAGAGLVTSLGIHGFFAGFWVIVGVRGAYEWVSAPAIFAVALLVLCGGVYTYTRGELLRGRRLRKLALVEIAFAVAVVIAVSGGIAFAMTHVNLSNAIFSNPEMSPRGDLVAVSANRANLSSEQIWIIDTAGSARRLAGRGSRNMAFSPDGEWVAYTRTSVFFGYPPVRFDLRVARADGSDDHRLGKSLGGRPVFSPDGIRIARSYGNDLSIARLDGDEVEVVALPGRFEVRDIGWSPDGEELLLVAPDKTVAFFHLASRDLRIFEPPEDWMIWHSYPLPLDRPVPSRVPISGYWRVPIDAPDPGRRTRREYGIGLIVRETLEAEILARGTCPAVAMDLSADERFLAYSVCDEEDSTLTRQPRRRSVVRLRNLDTGEDRELTTVRGSIGNLRFNASGESIVMSSRAGLMVIQIGDGDSSIVVDLREGDPGPGGHWFPVGWLDDSRLMLAREPNESGDGLVHSGSVSAVFSLPPRMEVGSLAVLDIETGEIRTVFER